MDPQGLAVKVKESADSQEADETLFADAPEHFLDAIMSVLMRDPVKLPSSGQVRRIIHSAVAQSSNLLSSAVKQSEVNFQIRNGFRFLTFQIVDRQTIARHLLSDQNDPFNRDPLTLDKVIPQDELKQVTNDFPYNLH